MDHPSDGVPTCPFCPFTDANSDTVAQHVESCHPDSDIRVRHGASHRSADRDFMMQPQPSIARNKEDLPGRYVECPFGCGETLIGAELAVHLDLHTAEDIALEEVSTNAADCPDPTNHAHELCIDSSTFSKHPLEVSKPPTVSTDGLEGYASIGESKRLGRSELGPHAHEKQMPSWLRKLLERGPKSTSINTISSNGRLEKTEIFENEITDVIPVLAQLCDRDTSVQRAFLCSPIVHQISKTPREGGFCGYRNIQMLITYIKNARLPGSEFLTGGLPTILQLQDMIENAWDRGFNSVGKIETGGIRGTRKYIGTAEAQALFSSLGIGCIATSIGRTESMRAHDALFMNIASYFRDACSLEVEDKVISTSLPPIYFQHQGHSMTIIGFEIRGNGSANLLVFDPMFKAPSAMKRLKDNPGLNPDPVRVLKGYRRGTTYLQKFDIFEILKLQAT